jgi:hypothetical protein
MAAPFVLARQPGRIETRAAAAPPGKTVAGDWLAVVKHLNDSRCSSGCAHLGTGMSLR